MITSTRALAIVLCTFVAAFAQAQSQPQGEQQTMTAEEFLASLTPQSGQIELPGGNASLDLPDSLRYLSPEDTERVLVLAWGNPPDNQTLGMVIPADRTVLQPDVWAVIIDYEEEGHVKDDDAESMDYDAMLKEMQASTEAANEARVKAGYGKVSLIGWATPPHYDKETRKLYWAKELYFGEEGARTLNYSVRILGRRGVLVLNMVGDMGQLAEIEAQAPEILAMTNFNPGHGYTDFKPDIDQVAAYGIGALVAGKIAAKAGLFAKLGVLLLALKKFWIFIVIGIGAVFVKFFKRKI